MEGQAATDPVCGMEVQVERSRYRLQWEGVVYHFCAPGCRKAFQADPGRYLDPDYTASME